VHLRRALLLFAIVLGLAAVAASISRPRANNTEPFRGAPPPTETESQQTEPTVEPRPSLPSTQLTFHASDPQAQGIDAGQAATVYVEVEQPGQVFIHDLGMSAATEPLTPARFDVLTRQTGRFPITFQPAGGGRDEERAGTLVVR
jgi:hypothetical protein